MPAVNAFGSLTYGTKPWIVPSTGLYMYISPFVLNRRQPFHSVIGPADLPCFKELLYSYVSESINVSAAILYRV